LEATALERLANRAFVAVVVEQVEISAKYSGYINRQKDEVARSVHYESLRLPKELDYMQVSALSIEARQKLEKNKPETLGQASRISGITPATISLLLIHLKRNHFLGRAAGGGSPVAGEVSV
jgi:tRNA uridine 5-carboxymethylaminomethyl modification enzyme